MKSTHQIRMIIMASIFVASLGFMPLSMNAAIIKGIVSDIMLEEGIPFATVKVFNTKDTITPTALFSTDMDGVFSKTINKAGNFYLLVESMGKKTERRELSIQGDETIDLGVINMEDDPALINEVEVVAMRPIVKAEADKLSYNVKEDSDSKNYTLLEMLRKVPMVSVDGDDNITVNGSASFQVYVNGKPSLMFSSNPGQIFKSMPASIVKSIEVVTNPGARYDAEGAGGVLNLVMDQQLGSDNNNGYMAGIGGHIGTRGFDGSMNVSGQKGKLTYSANAIYNKMNPGNTEVSNSQNYSDRVITTSTYGKPKMDFSLGNISVGYAIDSLSDISLTGSINHFGMESKGSTATDIAFLENVTSSGYASYGGLNLNRLSTNGSLSFSHGFADSNNSNLSIIYQIGYEKNKTANMFEFSDVEGNDGFLNLSDRKSDNLENTLDNILQADFTSHFAEGHTFDAGVKMSLRRSHSSSELDFISSEIGSQDTRYRNNNDILAAYTEYALPIGKINFKAGLRYEYTWQTVNYDLSANHYFSRYYGILVPSVSMAYNLPVGGNLGFTYNMRISRPGISYLNPYVDRSDPTSVTFGNPDLEVEKTHNIAVSYNLFTSKLILNARLTDSYTGNGIEQYRYVADGLLNTTYGNVAKRNYLRLDASAVWMAAEKMRLIINGSTGYVSLKNNQMHRANQGWQWNMMAGVQYTFPWNIKGSAYLIASSKSYTIEGWNSGIKMVTFNLSKTFLNDRLSVSAGLNSGLSRGGKMIIENYSHTSDFSTHNIIRMPMLSATVGLFYTLGNYQSKQNKNRKRIESDYIEQRSEMESLSGSNARTGE